MKVLIVLTATLVACVSCAPYDEDEANAAQPAYINATIANLTKIATSGDNKLVVLKHIMDFIDDNCKIMDELMMAESKRCEDAGLTLMSDFYNNIHKYVYLWGRKTAETTDFAYYSVKNGNDTKEALAKFAGTTNVIRWRCQLDHERREAEGDQCANADLDKGWKDWNEECKKVIDVLEKLIPQLEKDKHAFWAHQHTRMLTYIKKGIPKLNEGINAETDKVKQAKYLCKLAENLHLLNTVASSRPPGSK